jgi:hypothetical protein
MNRVAADRSEFRRVAVRAGVRRRFAPHRLRHAHALELAREGMPLTIIQRQLGHTNLGTTSIYLHGIDPEEIITAVRGRRAPMLPASAGLRFGGTRWGSGSASAPASPGRKQASAHAPPNTLVDRPQQAPSWTSAQTTATRRKQQRVIHSR